MALYKRKDGNVWWFKFKYGGELIRMSTHTNNRAEALLLEGDYRRKMYLGTELAGVKSIKLFEFIDRFLRYQKMKHSESHFVSSRGRLEKWVKPYFGNVSLKKITRSEIEGFLAWRSKQPNYTGRLPEPAEIQRTLACLKTLFNRGIDGSLGEKLVKINPCDGIQWKVPDVKKGKCLSEEELNRIMQYEG